MSPARGLATIRGMSPSDPIRAALEEAARVLTAFLGDARALENVGKFARAASGTDWMTPYLTALLRDPYSSVRMIARRTIAKQPEGILLTGYEPMGTPESWVQRSEPLYQTWAARRLPASAALLIGADGGMDMPTVTRLLSQRDNKPMVLNE